MILTSDEFGQKKEKRHVAAVKKLRIAVDPFSILSLSHN
jgi:hypothetical protein